MKLYMNNNTITIISGLPRSGTSMMMRMLEAGGMQVITDHYREADLDNPLGYFELEQVKKLKNDDTAWMDEAQGKAVKIISALLEFLPEQYQYQIIFMQRNMDEILASQKNMLNRHGKPTDEVSDEEMKSIFEKHLHQVTDWLSSQSNIDVIYLNYNQVLHDPELNLAQVVQFLEGSVDIQQMLNVIDNNLYRQRR